MTRRQAYELALSVYRGEINIATIQTGTLIRVLAYCVCQEEAALDYAATRQFVDNAEAVLNIRIPV